MRTARFRRLLDAAERRIAETGGVPHDEFWAAVEEGEPTRVAEKRPPFRARKTRTP